MVQESTFQEFRGAVAPVPVATWVCTHCHGNESIEQSFVDIVNNGGTPACPECHTLMSVEQVHFTNGNNTTGPVDMSLIFAYFSCVPEVKNAFSCSDEYELYGEHPDYSIMSFNDLAKYGLPVCPNCENKLQIAKQEHVSHWTGGSSVLRLISELEGTGFTETDLQDLASTASRSARAVERILATGLLPYRNVLGRITISPVGFKYILDTTREVRARVAENKNVDLLDLLEEM